MKELADSIKRLREYGDNISKDLRIVSPSPIQPLEVHSGNDTVALFAGSSTWNAEAFVAIPEAIQTINQLVELVAEMRVAATDSYQNAGCRCYEGRISDLTKETLTKADALLSGLNDNV